MKLTNDLSEFRAVLLDHPQMRCALENIPGGETVKWNDLATEVASSFGQSRGGLAMKIQRFFFHYLTQDPLHMALGLERIGNVGVRWNKPIEFRKEVCR